MKNKTTYGWNLETIREPETRPSIFNKFEGEYQPNGCDSYVYKLTNTQNGMIYIGYHKESDAIYRTSSSKLQSVFSQNVPKTFDYEVLFWGSVKECEQYEFELLTSVDAKNNPIYYNDWNGKPGVRKLNIKLVNQIMNEIDDVRKFRNQKTLHYINQSVHVKKISITELYQISKLQVRELEIDTENLNKIKDRIKNRIGHYDMPVILSNVRYNGEWYDYLLISGNHTRTSYYQLRYKNCGFDENFELDCLVLNEDVHKDLQESEIEMLANNLNGDYNVGKSFTVSDGVKECEKHHSQGHSWETSEMRQRLMQLGLTSNQVKTVFDRVNDNIIKQKVRKDGRIVYDYLDTHQNKLREKVDYFKQDDNVYVISSASGNPHLYRWIERYFEEQYYRLSIRKPIQTEIKVVVFHTNYKSMKQWKSLWQKLIRPQNIPHTFKDYHFTIDDLNQLNNIFKFPTFSYFEMPMEGQSVTRGTHNLNIKKAS